MNVESWCGYGNTVLVQMTSVDHLRHDKFTQNCKSSNFVNQCVGFLFNNIEQRLASNVVNLCHY